MMKPDIDRFLQDVMKMNDATVNPTARTMYIICKEVIQKWENYRILYGCEQEDEL